MHSVHPSPVLSIVPADDAPEMPAGSGGRAAVVIPCYRVSAHILDVIAGIGPDVDSIYVVDDACPEGSGDLVTRHVRDRRVSVIRQPQNSGVGGATLAGMKQAIADGADVIIKMDGDGQMDPSMLPILIDIVRSGQADYAKGNRFFDPEAVASMPTIRLLGNAALSFLAKISTGYWQSFDPTNGYVAIHAEVARRLPVDKISKRYFFETDLLFRLSTIKARVIDVPMPAIYGEETSGLRIGRIIVPFAIGHLRNFGKRIAYNYFLRDFSIASAQLVAGLAILAFGIVHALLNIGLLTAGGSAGVAIVSGLAVVLGVQLLLAFFAYDIQSAPASALHPRLADRTTRLRRRFGSQAARTG